MFNCGLILAQLLKKFAQEMKTLKPQLGKKLDEIDHQQAEKPKKSGNDSRIISQTQVQRGKYTNVVFNFSIFFCFTTQIHLRMLPLASKFCLQTE